MDRPSRSFIVFSLRKRILSSTVCTTSRHLGSWFKNGVVIELLKKAKSDLVHELSGRRGDQGIKENEPRIIPEEVKEAVKVF